MQSRTLLEIKFRSHDCTQACEVKYNYSIIIVHLRFNIHFTYSCSNFGTHKIDYVLTLQSRDARMRRQTSMCNAHADEYVQCADRRVCAMRRQTSMCNAQADKYVQCADRRVYAVDIEIN